MASCLCTSAPKTLSAMSTAASPVAPAAAVTKTVSLHEQINPKHINEHILKCINQQRLLNLYPVNLSVLVLVAGESTRIDAAADSAHYF